MPVFIKLDPRFNLGNLCLCLSIFGIDWRALRPITVRIASF